MSTPLDPGHSEQRRPRIMYWLGEWQRRYPNSTLAMFAWWFFRMTGQVLTEVATEQDSEVFMKVLGPDQVVAEALLEGLDSGP